MVLLRVKPYDSSCAAMYDTASASPRVPGRRPCAAPALLSAACALTPSPASRERSTAHFEQIAAEELEMRPKARVSKRVQQRRRRRRQPLAVCTSAEVRRRRQGRRKEKKAE